jgi:hypothetical protein
LVAHYWTGGAPAAQRIRDISSTGFYLLTEARWYPGTVVKITLQTSADAEGDAAKDGAPEVGERTIAVQSKVVRRDADGVGLEFVLPRPQDQRPEHRGEDVVSDQKTLDSFLERLGRNNTEIFIQVE